MRLNNCPCCGNVLLRHARQSGVYWFCTSCRQEMMSPLINEKSLHREILGSRSRLPQAASS